MPRRSKKSKRALHPGNFTEVARLSKKQMTRGMRKSNNVVRAGKQTGKKGVWSADGMMARLNA